MDLYLLLRDQGYTLSDYRQAFQEGGVPYDFEIGLQRLCSGTPQNGDEGYTGLLENPPTIEQMAEFFRSERDKFEQNEAAKVLRELKGNQKTKGAE